VIVAVFPMGMVKVAVDEVVHVIAMRHRFVTAAGAVNMRSFVGATAMSRRALSGICGCYRDGVIIDVTVVHVMEVSVLKVVGMSVVLDGDVAAVLAMDVGPSFWFGGRHRVPFSGSWRIGANRSHG
jgi:hypothetical protein